MLSNKDVYLQDCLELCNRIKYVAESWEWQPKPSKSSQLVATSSLLDENLQTVRGVILYGRYHIGEDTGFEHIHLGINLTTGLKSSICGLDVHPPHERSHFDVVHKSVYGSHFQIGDHRKVCVHQHKVYPITPDFEIANLSKWIELFKEKARVIAHNGCDITAPQVNLDLFGPSL